MTAGQAGQIERVTDSETRIHLFYTIPTRASAHALFQTLCRLGSLIVSTLAGYFVLGQTHAESAVLLLLTAS